MTSVYRHILNEAWSITKSNRWLWFFGLFATLLGNGGVFNILVRNMTSIQDQGAIAADLNSLFTQGSVGALFATLSEVFANLNVTSVLVILLVVVLGVFLLWLAIVTQAGLISGSFRLHKGQTTSFGESWQRGLKKFWPVLGLNLTTQAITYLLLILLGLPFFFLYVATQNLVWQWLFLIVSFMIFVPLAVIIASVVQYAIVYVVIKNDSFVMSFKEGWGLFKQNWIVTIEMSLALFIINILAGVGLMMALVFLALPFLIIGFISIYFSINILFNFALILGLLVIMAGVFLFGAMLSVFQTAAWVVLFSKLSDGIILPKILRLAESWSARKTNT